MVRVGKTVLINGSVLYGVVLGLSEKRYGMFRVRVWNPTLNRYQELEKTPLSLTEVNSSLLNGKVNEDDATAAEWYQDIAVGLAIDTKDKKWFNEFGDPERIKEG